MNRKYEPELDFDMLRDWCAFCEGSRQFPQYHFSTLLMGVFVGGLTPDVDRFLRDFSRNFPPSLYNDLARIRGDRRVSDRDVLPWVQRDLDEKRKLFDTSPEYREVVRVIDQRQFTFTHDRAVLREIESSSENHSVLYAVLGDFVSENCYGNEQLFELQEALYKGLAANYFVADSIMGPLLELDIDLGNYFEIYVRGGDYVIDKDRIVVYTYRPPEEGDAEISR